MRRPIFKKWQQCCLLTALLILAQAAPWMATSGYSDRSDRHLLLIEEPFEIMGKDYTPYAGNANRSRHVTLNPFLTHPDYVTPGDQLLIEFFEDVMFEAVVDSIMTNNIGTLIIRARINEKNFSHVLIVSTNHQTSVWVNVPETGKLYNITDNQLIEIKQENLDDLPLIAVEIPENVESLGVSDAFASSLSLGDDPALGSGHLGLMPDQLGVDDVATISVMIVYTPAARQWASSRGGIHNIIATAMANAQLAHDNSNTGVTFELVDSAVVDYVESGDSYTDLERLSGTRDGFMDEVHEWRDRYGADLVALFADNPDFGGLGYLLNNPNGNPTYGFSLTRVQQAATGYTHAHEMGHNMGLHHHKEQNYSPGPGLFSYSAGWRWTGTDDRKYCSVMTYTSGSYFSDGVTHTMVPYFSDPNIYYLGVPTGDVLDGDNARTVREIKHVIAAYRAGSIIPQIEREALIAVYESTDGDNWFLNYGWKIQPLAPDGFAEPGTECGWAGVTCQNNRLTAFNLASNGLTGPIPPELGNLSNLERLGLGGNHLTGPIPPELGILSRLDTLSLPSNQLTGVIPPELGSLINLEWINLYDNQLTGIIPPELGNLTNLGGFYLAHNQLTGPIPPWFGNLTGYSLHNNQLSGPIPPELSNLTNFPVDLSNNQLTGPIPPELGNLSFSSLGWIDLSNNQLSGSIPPELGNLGSMERFNLSNNQLSGSIPTELGNLVLHHIGTRPLFSLSNNQLSGPIPPELGNISLFENYGHYSIIDLSNNQLSGPIPYEFANNIEGGFIYLSNNQLSGPIPIGIIHGYERYVVDLSNNRFSGTVPPEIGRTMSELSALYLNDNLLIGPVQLEFDCDGCGPMFLREIHICNNYLYTEDNNTRDFLHYYQPGWEACQYPLPEFGFTPASKSVPANARSADIIIANTGGGTLHWTATVVLGGDWLSITSGSSGTNDGTVSFTFSQNTGYQRVGVIRFESITEQSHDYLVTQAAATCTLTTAVSPSGGGSVTRSPNESTFAHNDTVQLTANPNPGYTFSHWNGDASGSSNPVTVTMNANKSVTANFVTVTTHTLSISLSGSGSVVKNPDKTSYSHNNTVQLTATPSPGYTFSHWSDDASGSSNPVTVTMNANKSVTANFTADIAAPTFTPDGGVHTGDSVGVTVTCATPGVTIRYTTNGNEPTESSPTVASRGTVSVPIPGTLKARAWLGSDTSATTTAAYASPDDRVINLSILGRGLGKLSSQPAGISCLGTDGDTCTGVFDADAQVTLTANPDPGSVFKAWGGDCAGEAGNTCTLIMDTDKIIEAHFLLKDQPNAIGDYLSIVTLTPAERDFLLDIGDGTKPFPDTSQIEAVRFQNDTATIYYRDGTSQVVDVRHGDGYADDFINQVLLSETVDHTFTTLLNLPSFDVELEFPGNSVVICYPGISPVNSGPGIQISDLALLKLKPVGQPSLPFAYRVNAPADGDFWITNHLQEAVLPPTHTLNPGQVVDLYLAVEDNSLYDLDDTSNVIVDPLVLGQVEEQIILPPSELSYPATSSTGSFTVSWSASTGAVSYRLEHSTDGGSTWALRYTGSDRSYAESVGNGSYRYRVLALDTLTDSVWQTGAHDCVVSIQTQAESGGGGGGGGGCFIDTVLR